MRRSKMATTVDHPTLTWLFAANSFHFIQQVDIDYTDLIQYIYDDPAELPELPWTVKTLLCWDIYPVEYHFHLTLSGM